MDEDNEKELVYTIESPLKAWPGRVELIHPDHFTRGHWNKWRKAVARREKNKDATLNHILGYAGLEFIHETGGKLAIEGVTLGEMRQWEKDADNEHTKLLSWLGREMQTYIRAVVDPKE